jgi:hypothetical protein
MTGASLGLSARPAGEHPVLAWSAVLLAAVAVILSTLGMAGAGGAGAGMVLAVVAFTLAVAARARGVRWWALWLPLLTLPVLVATSPLWV